MFIGEYHHAIDEKNRLAVPTKFREALRAGAVVTRGLDACLVMYTKAEWEKLAEKLANMPISQANSRAFARFMLAGAMDVECDKQGRIVLPDYLKKYAKMEKQVVVAGLYNRLEIWDRDAWAGYTSQTEAASNDIAEHLGELGV